jgi:hypothetical protein
MIPMLSAEQIEEVCDRVNAELIPRLRPILGSHAYDRAEKMADAVDAAVKAALASPERCPFCLAIAGHLPDCPSKEAP